jgi:hypothetical protein
MSELLALESGQAEDVKLIGPDAALHEAGSLELINAEVDQHKQTIDLISSEILMIEICIASRIAG